ncbi:fimbria/pilus outer membrane usher protein [Erwinia sp. CPCC 100877]|nr:fimbria/pilus outer membrane usher protein [Erwinia sp. CPCC 100877]
MVLAADYFDPAALELSSQQQSEVDLSYFSRKGGQQPGTYKVNIFLNQRLIDERNIDFVAGQTGLVPVLTQHQLEDMGVNTRVFSSFEKLHDGETITQLGDFIPDASTHFDFSQQRLDISIPQAAMKTRLHGYVEPSLWDDGLPAAFINYSLSGSSTRTHRSELHSDYLSLRNGVNIGAWRLRNISAYRYDKSGHWDSQSTWLQRDIRQLNSKLIMGDSYTDGDIFDSVRYRGIQLSSDDNMLPESQRGFAPVIRGVAHSNARVTIFQHGYVIYETYVAPGAFEIKDLFPTAQSGDLEVSIQESNGSVRKFTQPYSAVPFMLRRGGIRYSVNVGRYHYAGNNDVRTPLFAQSTLSYGMPLDFTLYGGVQLAADYRAIALGVGRGFGTFGSLGVDATWASTITPENNRTSGSSLRIQYQKDFADAGTSFNLASYRYSSQNFYTFDDANQRNSLRDTRRRSRSELAVSQSMGSFGSLSISAYLQDYWSVPGQERTIHMGYYGNYKSISWGVGYYYIDSSHYGRADRNVTFNINIPFSLWQPDNTLAVNYSLNTALGKKTSQQATLYGALLDDNSLNYNVLLGHDSKGSNTNFGAGLDYHGSRGDASMGYSQDKYSRRLTYGLAGGIVAHPYGVTLSQPLGDAFALVRVPGAANVEVRNASHVVTDSRGFAVVPSLTAYRKNIIELDTETLGSDIDVELGEQSVVPDSGAVTLADFTTHLGHRILFTLRYHGQIVPFGAVASLAGEEKRADAIVADKGLLYLSGVPEQGSINVQWHDKNGSVSCKANFDIRATLSQSAAVKTAEAECL